jgi:Tol biopolymer transport system component
MGEVYKATDTRLGRAVALKVLSPRLNREPAARLRFEREARAVAALSHPHICSLYDIGLEGETEFLVMEYVPGETLAQRLQRGRLPIRDVLRIGGEVAEALAAAHRQGIIHRDVKPGNIMLTNTGAKLLDFGIAHIRFPAGVVSGSDAPTVQAAVLTAEGVAVGTPAYMAPEQREGRAADERTDVFALGAVIGEMVTGRPPGPAGLDADAPMTPSTSRAQPVVPPPLEHLVRACLAADPDDRIQSCHDVALQLRWIGQLTLQPAEERGSTRRGRRALFGLLPWGLAAAAGAAALVQFLGTEPPHEPPIIRFSVPGAVPGAYVDGIRPALSPDGRFVAFEVQDARNEGAILLRPLDSVEARPVSGTENGFDIFWAPGSRAFGFFAQGRLKTVSLQDGTVRTLCEAADTAGAAWNEANVVLFASGDGALYTVPADGGRTTLVAKPDPARGEKRLRWPSFLPDGRRYLHVVEPLDAEAEPRLYVGALGSSDRTLVPDIESRAIYAAPGYLLFARHGILMAAPFDRETLNVTGPAQDVTRVIHSTETGYAAFAVSRTGMLAMQTESTTSRLFLFDQQGREKSVTGPAASYANLRISPDGRSVAVETSIPRAQQEIWIREIGRESATRFTAGQRPESTPVWSPDGARLAYGGGAPGSRDIFERAVDGTGGENTLLAAEGDQVPVNWSRNGRFLTFDSSTDGIRFDVWMLPLEGDRKPVPIARTGFNECCGHISPDGLWVAYTSDESGRHQVYVKPFPGPGRALQVSTAGGSRPRWRIDRNELFFLENRKVLSVTLPSAGTVPDVPPARLIMEAESPIKSWDVMPKGDGLLLATSRREEAFPPIGIIVNWLAALNRR